ncbi:hypothetical protein GCM10027182_18890 [Aquaspirillum soli]
MHRGTLYETRKLLILAKKSKFLQKIKANNKFKKYSYHNPLKTQNKKGVDHDPSSGK